jgi:DNA polymerase III gamma/tau subunit
MKAEKNQLHKKYRPKTWAEVIGKKNQETCKLLRSAIREGKVHLFLLIGPSGCGKTTIARLIKDALGCSEVDFTELNAGNDRGIDSIRQLIHEQEFYPLDGEVKVILIDECHRLTNDSWNALLKVTEEPAPGTYFILSTTNPEKIPETMKNRCGGPSGAYKVAVVGRDEMTPFLQEIDGKEDVGLSIEIITEIVTQAKGSPRQALVLFEKIMNLKDEEAMKKALEPEDETKLFNDLTHSLLFSKELQPILDYFEKPDSDSEGVRRGIIGRMAKIYSNPKNKDVTRARALKIAKAFMAGHFYNMGDAPLLITCIELIE